MNKHSFLFALLAIIWFGACRQQEPQPVSEFPDVPTAVVQAVRIAYPTATGLSFTEIDKGNVWESDFSVQTVSHQATVNVKGSILEVYALGKGDGVTGPQSVTLPAAAQAYINKTYPGYKLVAIGDGQYNNQKAYKVAVRNEKEEVTLIFDASGAVILEFKAPIPTTPVPTTFPITKAEDLPAAASAYLRENGITLAKGIATVDKDGKKTYLVYGTKGTTSYELVFDNDGKLTRSSSSPPPPPATTTTVELKSINDLPTAAIAFLAGYTFEKGSVTTKEGKKTYSVVVNKDGKRYEMTFDGDGKVLTNTYTPRPTEKAMTSMADLPGTSREYLTKTYPGWSFVKGAVASIDAVVTSYSVVIKVGDVLYTVIFNGEGKFVSAIKG